MAAFIAIPPSSVAEYLLNFPMNDPMGVLLAETMKVGLPKFFVLLKREMLLNINNNSGEL